MLLQFVALPEREGLLTHLCNLDGLLLNTHPSLLVFVHKRLVAGDEDGRGDGLVAELVLHHVFLLNLLLHHHFVHFLLPQAHVFLLLITRFEAERLGYSDAIFALARRLDLQLVDVVVSCHSLVVQVTTTESLGTLMSLETTIIVLSTTPLEVIIVEVV